MMEPSINMGPVIMISGMNGSKVAEEQPHSIVETSGLFYVGTIDEYVLFH